MAKKKAFKPEPEHQEMDHERWAFEDKRHRYLVERFGETKGNQRFEAEKAAGFKPAKMWPAV